jgi:hypothetical protein
MVLASVSLALADDSTSSAQTSAETSVPTEAADDTVLVVGQREAPMTVVPRGLSVSLGAEQFEAINALNVEDLMKYAPNFFVRKRFAGDDNAVVALRGANTVQSARDRDGRWLFGVKLSGQSLGLSTEVECSRSR